jgi:hypothetical protein
VPACYNVTLKHTGEVRCGAICCCDSALQRSAIDIGPASVAEKFDKRHAQNTAQLNLVAIIIIG